MSHYKLEQLKRRLKVPDKPAPEPEQPQGDAGLGAAIQILIQQEVQRQTAVAKQPAAERLQNIDRQVAEHAESIPWQREFGAKPSNEWPKPPATTPFPKAPLTVELRRDKAGKTIGATVGDKEFRIERNGAGRAVRMVEVT